MLKQKSRGSQTSPSVWAGCCALALGGWLAAACGGQAETVDGRGEQPPSAGGASAGGASAGGASAGGASAGGASAGGASTGGASPAGAPGMPDAGASGAPDYCANIDCADIVCPLNTAPTVLPGSCCATCQSTCKPACTPCAPGSHPVMHAAECCPACEQDMVTTPSCDSGKMSYAAARAQMLDKYSQGCATDQDCAAMAPKNLCEPGCAYAAVLAIETDNFNGNLSSDAKLDCVNCMPIAIPKCVPPPPAVCVKGVCQLSVP